NDELAMRLLKTEITSGGSSGDGVGIDYSVSSANVLAKEYPYVQIAYRAHITNITTIDLNVGINKFHPSGDTSTTKGVRLWGIRPSYVNDTFTTMYFDSTKFTGGQDVGSPYSWNNVSDDGIYTYLRMKLWGGQGGKTTTTGDTFEVQYIAFFTDEDTMNSFVYDTELRGITVPENVTVTKGTVTKLDVELEPTSAYAKLVYESQNEYVARVTEDGKIVALMAGQVTINVSTHDGKYSASCVVNITEPEKDYSDYIIDRDNLENLVYRLNNDKELNVVYLGGSVTAGAGASSGNTCWRALIGTWLTEMFPDATINNVNSAMGGSGSMLGAFRTDADVLAHDPDLVFVEFAVNDSYSGHYSDGTVQLYYESILRQIREKSPETEIISLFVTDQGLLHQTDTSPIAKLQDAVAAHYGVSSIDVGRAMNNHIVATGATWSEYVSDSVHPGDKGYAIYGDAIKQYLFAELFEAGYNPTALTKHTVPETYVDSRNETFVPVYVEVTEDTFDTMTGWTYSSNRVYSNLDTDGYVYPSAAENSITYTFKGTGIAFYVEFNGGGYYFNWSIDGGETTSLKITDTNHPFNKMFKTGVLEDTEHTITFSYGGTDNTGGTNSNVKLTRLLVSKIASEEEETDILYGDVDGNGKVEPADSVALSRYNAQWTGYSESDINMANADVDGVEGVSSSDAVVLSRYNAQWAGYETLPLTPTE
ncbi:MAG: Ig-like domain-containing protein, partial [Clostridia bacterium]|nr:Ig-like domain-containing protein [Clostridia bacterium]